MIGEPGVTIITDARAEVIETISRRILIRSAILWMRPQSHIMAAYSIQPPYGRVVEIAHGLTTIPVTERQFIIGLVEAEIYRHPDATYRPYQLHWDESVGQVPLDGTASPCCRPPHVRSAT